MMTTKRILIVDDEKGIREILRPFFESQGFEVFEATDGVEAVEMARKESFDVVLTDLKMPGLDGLEVLKRIKEISPETAVSVIAEYPSTETVIKALELTCHGFLRKPLDLGQLDYLLRQGLLQ